MNAFYNIPADLVVARDETNAAMHAADAAWVHSRDAGADNSLLTELWENYEETRRIYHEALWTLQQAWLDAWRAEEEPTGISDDLGLIEAYTMRSELDRHIIDAYILLGYNDCVTDRFRSEIRRIHAAIELCNLAVMEQVAIDEIMEEKHQKIRDSLIGDRWL